MFDISSQLYFIGIGGTAMGNVALACAANGLSVGGSDNAIYPPMSEILSNSGIEYYEGYSEKNLENKNNAIIVVGNAISRDNIELEYALDNRLRIISMPELIGRILIGQNTSVVISGTHGKTTVSSLTAWLLDYAGTSPGFLIGGVPGNFNVGCRPKQNGIFVSEGDEYDAAFFDKRSKFMHYRPDIAVINNIEFDHADVFDSIDDIAKSFRLFARLVPQSGSLLVNSANSLCRSVADSALAKVETFGIEEDALWRAVEIEYSSEGTAFTLLKSSEIIGRIATPLFGEMNVRNAVAAIAASLSAMQYDAAFRKQHFSLSEAIFSLLNGFINFKLPKRRLEVLGKWKGAIVVDDFAHHPTAIAETLHAAQQKFPKRRLIVCFEPRSNTTTRSIFQKELTECFIGSALVVFCPLNRPERYAVDERLDLTKLQNDIESKGITTHLVTGSTAEQGNWGFELAELLHSLLMPNDVILLFSNGNLGGLRKIIKEENEMF